MENPIGWLFVVGAWCSIFFAPIFLILGFILMDKAKKQDNKQQKTTGIILITAGALPLLAYAVIRLWSAIMILRT